MKITQKPGTVFFEGMPVFVENEVREIDDSFYISYNCSSREYGCDTTAIVLEPQMSKFYILCGDHRKQYAAAGNLTACLEYFASRPELQHKYSDKLTDNFISAEITNT